MHWGYSTKLLQQSLNCSRSKKIALSRNFHELSLGLGSCPLTRNLILWISWITWKDTSRRWKGLSNLSDVRLELVHQPGYSEKARGLLQAGLSGGDTEIFLLRDTACHLLQLLQIPFLPYSLATFLITVHSLTCSASQSERKREVKDDKIVKDYIIKGRTQAIKQVATVKPPDPSWIKTLLREVKSSD